MSRLLFHGGSDLRASRLPSMLGLNAPTFPGPRYSPAHPACTTSASMHSFMPKFMTTVQRRPASAGAQARDSARPTLSTLALKLLQEFHYRAPVGSGRLPIPSDETTTSSRKRAYSQVYQLTVVYTIWRFVPNLDFLKKVISYSLEKIFLIEFEHA